MWYHESFGAHVDGDLRIYYGMQWDIYGCFIAWSFLFFLSFCPRGPFIYCLLFVFKLGLYLPSILVLFLECFLLFCMVGGALFGKRFVQSTCVFLVFFVFIQCCYRQP